MARKKLTHNGHELVVDSDRLLHDGRVVTVRWLTRQYPASSPVWVWLREHGLRRVSTTSGPGGKVKNRTKKTLSISAEDARRLETLAERLDCTESEVVSRALVAFEALLEGK